MHEHPVQGATEKHVAAEQSCKVCRNAVTFRRPDRLAHAVIRWQVADAADLPGCCVQNKQGWGLLAGVQFAPVLLNHAKHGTASRVMSLLSARLIITFDTLRKV